MDKFGIFKLLNSFFDFYKQNSDGKNGFSLNSLFPSSAPKPESQSQCTDCPKNTPPKSSSQTPPPLREQMLSTIRTHDDIVKRVNSLKK